MTLQNKIESMQKRMDEMGIEVVFEWRNEIENIQAAVCAICGVSIEEMLSPGRPQRTCIPRMVSMFLCRTKTVASTRAIATAHRRDRYAVIHACETLRETTDSRLRRVIQSAERLISEQVENRNGITSPCVSVNSKSIVESH